MPPLIIDKSIPDPIEAISREIEYWRRRGIEPVEVIISPEVHEIMRFKNRLPVGSVLLEHDGVPVRVNKKFIGLRAWRVRCAPIPAMPKPEERG